MRNENVAAVAWLSRTVTRHDVWLGANDEIGMTAASAIISYPPPNTLLLLGHTSSNVFCSLAIMLTVVKADEATI